MRLHPPLEAGPNEQSSPCMATLKVHWRQNVPISISSRSNLYHPTGFWNNITSGASDGGDIDNYWDLQTRCPPVLKSSSSSSSSTKTTTTSKTSPTPPAPSPYIQGAARTNSVKCHNSGETVRMQSAASSFCGDIENDILRPGLLPHDGFSVSVQWRRGLGHDRNIASD